MEQCEQSSASLKKACDDNFSEKVFRISEKDLLLDMKVLIKEYYCGMFTEDEQSLKLQFTNGQTFIIG